MVEFLVRQERKLDVKTVRRLEWLEKENDEQEDEEREASLSQALSHKTKVAKLVVDKWFVDKSFGFGKVHTGQIVFIHRSAVVGAEVLTIGTDALVQVVSDDARAQGRYRARRAWGRAAWKQEEDKERVNKVAQQVRGAAALTAELAAQSEKVVSAVCNHPHGLHDEPAAALSAKPPATGSPFSLTDTATVRNLLPAAQRLLTVDRGLVNFVAGIEHTTKRRRKALEQPTHPR